MITWRDAWQELGRRPGRSLLSLFSVVIAVGAIVAVAAATAMTRQAYMQVFRSLAGSADLEVTTIGNRWIEADSVAGLDKLPGVKAMVPVLNRATIMRAHDKDDRIKIIVEGVVFDQPESIGDFTVVEGHWPEEKNEVMLDQQMAARLELKPGDEVRLLVSPPKLREHCTISGLFRINDAAHMLQEGTLLAPLDRLQAWYKMKGKFESLHLFLAKGADRNKVMAEVAKVLPEGTTVQIPATQTGLAEDSLKLTNVSLNLTSALSLTTAMFIVLNVFLMSVGERRRQISILRAVGATRQQIMRMVTAEALLVGVGGTIIGLPVGIYGGRLLAVSMAQILQVDLPESPALHWPILIGIVFGPLLCFVGAWYPARMASKVSPLEGLRPHAASHSKARFRRTTTAGLIGTAISFVLALWCAYGGAPMGLAVFSVVFSLINVVLLLPAVLGPLVGGMAMLLGRIGGYPMEIAERLVVRETGRTSITVGVLFMAVAAGLGTSNAVLSITTDVNDWCDQTMKADYLIRTMAPNTTVRNAAEMPEELGDELRSLPGVAQVDTGRVMGAETHDNSCFLVSRNFAEYKEIPLAIVSGDAEHMLERLTAGEVVVGEVLARRAKLHVGDMLEITVGDDKRTARVAGICTEYSWGGLIIYIDRATAQKLFDITGVDGYIVKAQHPVPPELTQKLKAITDREGLLLHSFTELRARVDNMVNGVVGGLWVLLALGLVVGAMGVVNTLTMNVLEQTQELGMLRAIGMPRGQLMRTIFSQAALIGLLGIAAGAASGLLLAWMINLSLASLFGHSVKFAMRPEFVAVLIAGAVAIIFSSAAFPALRAARLSPIEAMRSE